MTSGWLRRTLFLSVVPARSDCTISLEINLHQPRVRSCCFVLLYRILHISALSITHFTTILASALTCYFSPFHLTARQVNLTLLIGRNLCRALHWHILESQTPALRLQFLHRCLVSDLWIKKAHRHWLSLAIKCSYLRTG